MVMMALLPPGGLLGGYGADPDGVNGSWEEACTCVSTSIRVRVAVAAGEYPRHLPQRLFLACPRPASMATTVISTFASGVSHNFSHQVATHNATRLIRRCQNMSVSLHSNLLARLRHGTRPYEKGTPLCK